MLQRSMPHPSRPYMPPKSGRTDSAGSPGRLGKFPSRRDAQTPQAHRDRDAQTPPSHRICDAQTPPSTHPRHSVASASPRCPTAPVRHRPPRGPGASGAPRRAAPNCRAEERPAPQGTGEVPRVPPAREFPGGSQSARQERAPPTPAHLRRSPRARTGRALRGRARLMIAAEDRPVDVQDLPGYAHCIRDISATIRTLGHYFDERSINMVGRVSLRLTHWMRTEARFQRYDNRRGVHM